MPRSIQIEGHYPAEGTERDAARERLATVVVTLGNTCRHLDAAELQTRAIAMLDPRESVMLERYHPWTPQLF